LCTIHTGFVHWNHEYIQHWNSNEAKLWPKGKHDPYQNDIGADYFPYLGPYASSDSNVINQHMAWAVSKSAKQGIPDTVFEKS